MVSPGATCCQNYEVAQHQQPLLFLLLLSLLYQLVAPLGSTHRYPNHSGLEMAFAHPKISFGSRLSIDTSLRKFPLKIHPLSIQFLISTSSSVKAPNTLKPS